jgi:membrane fusion protein, multidrug efflux system
MKKSIQILSTLLFLFLIGCGEKETTQQLADNGDLVAIRAKKKELSDQLKSLNAEMAILDSVIGIQSGEKNLPLVTTFQSKQENFKHFIELQGTVATKQNMLIYPEVAGILVKVNVNEGQRVSKGQILASIDNGGLNSQLIQLKTQLALSKTTFERQERLWEQKIGSEIQYLQAKTSYETQQSAVTQLERQLAKFTITAPFNGIIDDIIKEQGSVVAPAGPGSEIFRIINLSEMYIEVAVPESYIANIKEGTEVQVHIGVLNKIVASKVRSTGNFINPSNRSFSVEIPVPNSDSQIKPNMSAKVMINDYTSAQAVLIPQSIISENAEGDQYAFLATKMGSDKVDVVKKRIITTGRTQGDYVEVLSGIMAGENIIQEGARSVKDGQEVKIITK